MLAAFDDGHRVLTLSQIARRARVPLSTAHRLVADLAEARFLVRRADGSYEIGTRIWHLGMLTFPALLREAALPHLQDLVATTDRTVHLAILDGSRALVVERLSGSKMIPTRHRPGGRLPLHCTAVGKVLLANADTDHRAAAFEQLTRYTPFTIDDPVQLERQLEQIRHEGLARSAQEHRLGVSSLAVPVLGRSGIAAALGVLAPLKSARLASTVTPLLAASANLATSFLRVDLEPGMGETLSVTSRSG